MSIFKNKTRDHDSLYLYEDQYSKPKEYFKKAFSILKEKCNLNLNSDLSFLDIGCASGDFLRFINHSLENNRNIKFFGSDVMKELLDESKKRFPLGKFKNCDLSLNEFTIENSFKINFDVITMLSVHMIFDDLFWLDNIVNSLKKNGKALIWGLFNPYPYDLVMRVKKSSENCYQPGWNLHSKQTIAEHCKKLSVSCEFIDFQPDIDIKRNINDGLRAWSIDLPEFKKDYNPEIYESNQKRIFTNATRIIHDRSFCIISK